MTFTLILFKENKWTRIQCELNLERSFEDNITLCNPTKRADHTLVGVNGKRLCLWWRQQE